MDLRQKTFGAELPEISRAEIRAHVQAAWRMRSERRAELLGAAGRGIVRLARALMVLVLRPRASRDSRISA